MKTIEISNLKKSYGKTIALDGVTLRFETGMYGLLGRNGAGKTTLMKIIATLLSPTEGDVKVLDYSMHEAAKIRNVIGYLPQDFSMYPRMTAYEALDYLALLSGLDVKTRRKKVPELLRKVNLENHFKTKVKAMSGGMKRRLGIASALIHDPQVLIIDEPTAGLDPEERIRFRNLLSDLSEDKIVILSTHISADIEASCDKVGILDHGKLLFDGSIQQLMDQAGGKIFTCDISKLDLKTIKDKYILTGQISSSDRVSVRFISETTPPFSAKAVPPNLEDAYMYQLHKAGGDLSC